MRHSLLFCLLLVGSTRAAEPTFEKDVLPILRANCLGCHGGLRQRAGLDLRTLESALKGSESGPVILPKNAETSLLWKKIASDEMPKEAAKLSAHDKKILRAWIESGASKSAPEPTIAVQGKPRDPKAVAEMIDKEIDDALLNAKVAPSRLASDAEFLRRLHLDILGRIPTPDEVKAFLADQKSNKREAAIDALLARPEFGQHFGVTWHHLLEPLNSEGKRDYNDKLLDWLKESLNGGRPLSKTLGEVLTAQGDVKKDFKSSFLLGRGDPGPAGLQVGRLFLGIDLECAECHNHPHSHWRQKEDFWGIAAFFGQTTFKNSLSERIAPKPGIKIPTTALTSAGSFVPPNFPGSATPVDAKLGNRQGLADWLASRENPYFTRNVANRLWAQFFGRGLVHPLSDLRPDNLATHPATLSLLAAELHAADHDIRHLIRCICRTQAYGRSSLAPEGQSSRPELYDRMPMRTVTPDVLYDSLCVALGQEHLRGLPKRTLRPGQEVKGAPLGMTPRFSFVNKFPFADEPPSPLDYDHGELQVLTIVNLLDGNGEPDRFKAILDAQPPPNVVDELYLATLSRLPTDSERKFVEQYVSSRDGERRQAYLSVYWGLINASEFVFNH